MNPPPRRASTAKSAINRAMGGNQSPVEPSNHEVPPATQPSEVPPPVLKVPANPDRSKFTLLLSESDAIMWDELATMLRRELGRRVDKASFVRALVYLAADDPDLRRQVGEQIARDTTA